MKRRDDEEEKKDEPKQVRTPNENGDTFGNKFSAFAQAAVTDV